MKPPLKSLESSVIWWKPVFRHPVDGWCAGGCWLTLAQCDPWKPVFSSNPKNPVLGFHGWDETAPQGSVYLVSSFFFFPWAFFLSCFFFPCSHFFPGPFFFSFFLFLEITHMCIMHRVHTSFNNVWLMFLIFLKNFSFQTIVRGHCPSGVTVTDRPS